MLTGMELADFRSYSRLTVALEQPVSLFIGANGQGKTNFIEAVFFLSLLRSFRTSSCRDLCRDVGSSFRITGQMKSRRDGWVRRLGVVYGEKRLLQIDERPIRTSGEFIGQFQVVAFTAEDLRLVSGPAPLRRRFLDMSLAAADQSYLQALQQYVTALKSRNAALRSSHRDERAIAAFEPVMAQNGAVVINARQRLTAELQDSMSERLSGITRRQIQFRLRYQTQFKEAGADALCQRLAAERRRDMERGYTGCGPHLDDLMFLMDGHDLRRHGSTGQCRLASLCLKMGLVKWCRQATAENGRDLIVLVDDVTGELDAATRTAFLAEIHAADQLMVTMTETPKADDLFPEAAKFKVASGSIIPL